MAFKSVSAIAVAFASIAAGVSIDYALHIIFECSKDGASDLKKVSGIARRLSRPVAIAALTTLAAFVFVGISGSEGFGQMGVFGGVSIIVCAAASIAILPPIIAKFGADKLGKSLIERLSDKLSKALSRHSRLCLAAFFAVCLASIFALPMLEFDGKISSFSGVSKSAGQDAELVRKSCASLVSKTAFAVGANDFFEAANANERLLETLQKTEGASEIASLAPLFPNKIIRAQNIERWRKFFAPENLEKYSENLKKACSENGFKFGNFSPALARLSKEPNTNSALQEMRGDPLFSAIFNAAKIDENGETFFLTTASLSQSCDKSALQKSLPQGALMADGETFQNRVSELARVWILRFIILCPALIFAFLAIAFKSVFRAFIIMVPVLGGLLASFAAMAVLGVKISLVNAVFVIFAVCLAQDYSVFFACERGGGESSKALPAVLASALTTIAGFGALAFARHPVLRGLGESAAISIFSIFTMSILFRGAASKFLRPRAESPAPKTPWRGKSHGGYFGHLCFTFLIRRFGLKPAYALLFFVAIYFAFFKRGVFRQSANYIRAAQGECGIIKLPLKVFRHIYSFGAVLIEKWACVSGYGGVAVENPDAEKIAAALSEGAGLVAVSAHFGA
ncbi:MAG: hypothetical protein J6P03_08495, partial [Opitutales bacterium]|nr:hypothetical protein [Opitutales bacterium]